MEYPNNDRDERLEEHERHQKEAEQQQGVERREEDEKSAIDKSKSHPWISSKII